MPAHRSAAEGVIRAAVVEKLHTLRPKSRVIHEINIDCGRSRTDVLCVGEAEIIAVEIKSEKDKLDRLPDQLGSMKKSAHRTIVAMHERFLVEQQTNKYVAHYMRDGDYFLRYPPPETKGADEVWVFPEIKRAMTSDEVYRDNLYPWRDPSGSFQITLPEDALHILWREELYDLCLRLQMKIPKNARMKDMIERLRWERTGAEVTRGICAALRARTCIEADAVEA